jgi:hypothetical protein
MSNEQLIELYNNFLCEDINWKPIFNEGNYPGHMTHQTIITFDVRNSDPKNEIPYFKVDSIDQIKEVFRHFCNQAQCRGREDIYDDDFQLNLNRMSFHPDSDLFLAIYHDNRINI